MKKVIWIAGCIVFIVMIVIGIKIVATKNYTISLTFEDDEMKETIKNATIQYGIREKEESFSEKHIDGITRLNIGYTGYYTTLLDIKKCKNLKLLIIGKPNYSMGDHYYKVSETKPISESEERIKQIQAELGDILNSCSNMWGLEIYNEEGSCQLNSLEFLRDSDKLQHVYMCDQKNLDYSPLFTCKELIVLELSGSDVSDLEGIEELKKLKTLDIRNTNISEPDNIIQIANLETLRIAGTPLAENEEVLNIIREALPGIRIDVDSK